MQTSFYINEPNMKVNLHTVHHKHAIEWVHGSIRRISITNGVKKTWNQQTKDKHCIGTERKYNNTYTQSHTDKLNKIADRIQNTSATESLQYCICYKDSKCWACTWCILTLSCFCLYFADSLASHGTRHLYVFRNLWFSWNSQGWAADMTLLRLEALVLVALTLLTNQ